MDTFPGTDFDTFTAGGAFVVVNDSVVIDHVDCVVWADLFALAAADTTVFTDADSFFGVEVAGADDFHSLILVEHADEVVRAGFFAHATAGTFFPVNNGYPIDDVDGLKLTGLYAVAKSQTTGSALFFAVIEHVRGSAGHSTGVDILILYSSAFAVAADGGFSFCYILEGGSHDLADLAGDFVAAGDTEIGLSTVFNDGVGISLTAGIAAGAAVGVGQAVLDVINALVLLDGKDLRKNRKQNTRHKSERHKKQNGQNIFHGRISPI